MNQRHWIYVGPYRRQNRIGLMHGPNSGNFIIYYNDKIILIDFKVFESRTYNFFIDNRFCEISVNRKRRGYTYEFKFDNEADTPLNRSRKESIRKNNRNGFAVFVGGFLLLFGLVFGYWQWRQNFLEQQFKENAAVEWATTRIITRGISDNYERQYYFYGDRSMRQSSKRFFSSKPPTTPHGLPLENGDVFAVRYVRGYDYYHKINYDEPNVKTALAMMERVLERHIRFNQGRMRADLLCEVQAAFDLAGMRGLAYIYHQNVPPSKNEKYNTNSYLRFVRDTPFKKAFQACKEKQ